MPELTVVHIGLLAGALLVGVIIGWFVRADRCAKEKIAVNASWQDQLESQQSEHNRLAEQNKSLMEQISQYQASHKDHTNRARELSESLKETFARRDELQRQLKDMRAKLELAVAQRNKARDELALRPADQSAAMKEKDDKIFKLSRELTSWQSRVPPLVERFQARDREARELEEALAAAQTRIEALDQQANRDNTRIEPVDAESLPDGGDASNEPIAMTAAQETATLQDQIDDDVEEIDELEDFVDPVDEDEVEPVAGDDDLEDVFFAAADHSDVAVDQALVDGDDRDAFDEAFDDVGMADTTPAFGEGREWTDGGTSGEDTAEPGRVDLGARPDERPTGNGQASHLPEIGDVRMAGADDEKDDLKKIKGIGPSIEKTLNDLGVFRFHQIAEMSEYEIDRVAQQLKGFRSRIYREDWIGQARDLQYEKINRRS
jgi:predicted flap endonuclease-1-like 5' DNA nuclease/uncharacterized coiled-coil DUF342 family protein